MKILSIIIPSYNSEPYLDKCIRSLLAPEVLDKLDIMIVNDGSADGTAAVAEKYCAAYPNSVRLISQENKGHGGALNTGFAAAVGKYLKPIDADDWVETENLPQLVHLLENSDSDVVLTHHHTIDIGTGEIKNWRSYPEEFGRSYSLDEIMAQWKSFDRSLTFHGITYKTAFYRQYGIQLSEHVFYEDHEYATFPCCHAKTVTPFDLFVYDYRIGDVQQSVSEADLPHGSGAEADDPGSRAPDLRRRGQVLRSHEDPGPAAELPDHLPAGRPQPKRGQGSGPGADGRMQGRTPGSLRPRPSEIPGVSAAEPAACQQTALGSDSAFRHLQYVTKKS